MQFARAVTLAGVAPPRFLIPIGQERVQAILRADDPHSAEQETKNASEDYSRVTRGAVIGAWIGAIGGDILFGALILWLASVTPLSNFLSVPLYAAALALVLTLLVHGVLSALAKQFIDQHQISAADQAVIRSIIASAARRLFVYRTIELVVSALAIACFVIAFNFVGRHSQTGLHQLVSVVDLWSLRLADFLYSDHGKTPRQMMMAKLSLGGLHALFAVLIAWASSQVARRSERKIAATR